MPDAPITGWQITGQSETTELDARGQVARGVRVQFVTGKGQHGSVFVPQVRYNPTNIRAAVASQAAQMDEVLGLSG